MLLADVADTSRRVAAEPGRSAKIQAMADLIRRLDPDETEAAVAFLAGEPRQGKIGVGWATIASVDVLPAPSPTLTIAETDQAVSALLAQTGPRSVEARRVLLADLLGRATPEEADLIRRVLTGELRQGALEGLVVEAVAKAAGVPPAAVRRGSMLAGDLPGVAAVALREGIPGLENIALRVLRPLQPMLASTAVDVAEAIGALGRCSIEWKLDGARIQAHRAGDEVRLFTRNLNDVSARMPDIVAALGRLPVTQVVLDGEVLGVAGDERPDAFQDTMRRFGRHDGGGEGLGIWFFDCLHVDGVDLIDRPLSERQEALERVAPALRVPSLVTDDIDAGNAFLAGALAAGHEGVMAKAIASPYEAGRRGKAWRKVKPVLTLDLVVLGAEWGHGRRHGWLSNLHLGARDPAGGFVMVGKTFKGLTDELLTWQTGRFLELERARHGIVVEVRPELVVEIALDGVQRSSRYAGGVALRFARVRRYRPDKSPAEADTIEAVRALLPRSG